MAPKKYFLGLFSFIFLIQTFVSLPLQAEGRAVYPGSLWSSERIPDSLIGVRVAHLVQPESWQLLALSEDRLYIYNLHEESISKILEYNAKGSEKWIKLDVFDVNGDGLQEVLLSGFYLDRPRTIVLQVNGNKINNIQSLDYFVHVIPWKGRLVLVSQKSFGAADFTGPLLELAWDGKMLVQKGKVGLPGGLSGESPSLYAVAGFQVEGELSPGLMTLSPLGKFVNYQMDSDGKFKKKWSSGEVYGGSVQHLNREVKNILNQTEQRRFLTPMAFQIIPGPEALPVIKAPQPVLPTCSPTQGSGEGGAPTGAVTDPSLPPCSPDQVLSPPTLAQPILERKTAIFVPKNAGYLNNVVGVAPAVKNAQMVRLSWTGYGFQEDWNSPRLDGAISDFVLVDWDGDGREEVLATFLLRDHGYVDTLKKQDSLILVLKPDK